MNHKRTTISIVLATLILVSLFAVVSSAASVSGTVMAGTGPATTYAKGGIPVLVAVDTSSHVWSMNGTGGWSSIGGSATSSPAATTPTWSMVCGTSLSVAPTAPSGRRLPRMMAPPGPAGTPSAGNSHPAPVPRPVRGAQVVSTSLQKVRTASCIINGLQIPAPRGPAGNLSAEN